MAESTSAPYSVNYDLSNCDAEPVHLIRHFQQPAFLVVVETTTLLVAAHSGDVPASLSSAATSLLGASLKDILDPETFEMISHVISAGDAEAFNPLRVYLNPGVGNEENAWNLIIKPSGDHYLLEFEPRDESVSSSAFLHRMNLTLQRIQAGGKEPELFDLVTTNIRRLTSYDRVMLYCFDDEYNGEVVAETKADDLPAYLNLRYPHTDIPSQARALFLRNHIRHIVSTADGEVSNIKFGADLKELDLSSSANRGASPIHLEYLRNMGVGATLTIAIVVNQKLWGLIACHHGSAKLLDYRLRSMISLVGKILSGHLALRQSTAFSERVLGISIIRSRLFERMNSEYDIVSGLLDDPGEGLLNLIDAKGAVLVFDNSLYYLGQCPEEEEVRTLVSWLEKKEENFFATNTLFKQLPEAEGFSHPPAGMMAIRLSRSPGEYILWFRPEVIKTISWGGQPDQRKYLDGGRVRLHPNLSFQRWEQNLSGTAEAWESYQKDAAFSLRNDIKEVILRKYQEVRKLNGQLLGAYEELETFSYTVSHDLRAPLRNIKGFAEILYEDYYDGLPEEGKMAIDTILRSVGRMNQFINDMLSFSRLGSTEPTLVMVNMAELTEEVWGELKFDGKDFKFSTDIDNAVVRGDRIQLKQLILNLLSNAVKYTSNQEYPAVSVSGSRTGDEVTYVVTDNGIGLDMKHAENVFKVFNRLVSEDQYEGTGVGLAIVKRIVDKYQGRISVHSIPGQGATFTLVLPVEFQIEDKA